MNHLSLKHLGKKIPFIDTNTCRRARSGMEQVWHYPRIIKMPMLFRNRFFHISAFGPPTSSGYFAAIAVVAVFHNVVDTHTPISIIIIIALPKCAETINNDHPVVTKIPTQSFKTTPIKLTAKYHSLLVRVAAIIHLISCKIDDRLAILIFKLFPGISKIEV